LNSSSLLAWMAARNRVSESGFAFSSARSSINDEAAPLAILEVETSAPLDEPRAEARRAAEEVRAASTERA
jgi:hypothetical protein